MAYDAIITGSHVVLPSGIVDRNILIDQGKIVKVTSKEPACDIRIDGAGMVSMPGVIDTHVHYGVYSPIDEAARTESHAGAIGGVCSMMRMMRMGGSYKDSLQAQLDASSKNHYIDYAAHASIFNAGQVEEMEYITQKGIASFKIYMNLGSDIGHVYMEMEPGASMLQEEDVEMNDEIIESIVKRAAGLGSIVCVHAEDYESCSCGITDARNKHQDGLAAWSRSRSPEYEAKAIAKISRMARRHGCALYFVHIGSAAALEQIKAERSLGTKIFAETCPHYLMLSYEQQEGYLAKVMPPIRSRSDVGAVWQALGNAIDTIGTDHVANRIRMKLGGGDVWGALAGFPGIGTSLPILLSEGVNRDRITLEQLARLTSGNAAGIFSMRTKGAILPGLDADIAMVDLKMEKKVESGLFGEFSDYTVYEGLSLKGWPKRTIVRGRTVAEDFEVVGDLGWGRQVPRETGAAAG